MSYGLKIYGTNGETKIITPDDATVIAAGSVSMPNSLESDNTYGVDIDLGGIFNEDEISVLVVPRRPNYNTVYQRFIKNSTLYYNTFYLDSTKTYYTRNPVTGVMTSFSAGDRTAKERSTWNPILSVFPIAFWDKMGAVEFTNARLFAATAYLIKDTVDEINFSLAGTASASGLHSDSGPASNINDDDEDTYVFDGCGVIMGNSCSWSYNATVALTEAKTITNAEIVHAPYSRADSGCSASGNYSVRLYYGGAWHTVFGSNWGGNYNPGSMTTFLRGFYQNVTHIRVQASGSAKSGGWSDVGESAHYTQELRAWGIEGENNKAVYSIGDNGIKTVDYVVCRKKYS